MSKTIKQIKHQLSNANLELDKSRLKMDTPDTDLNIIIEYLQLKDTLNKFSEKVNEAVDTLYLTESSGDTKKKKRKNKGKKGWGVRQEFDTLKHYLYDVMERHPETRNSDNILYFTILQEMGAHTLEEAKSLNVNLISIHKIRQVIQNKEGLYPPARDIKNVRNHRADEIREYMREQ